MLDLTTRWSARVARHIIVPSQQTADDLEFAYKVKPDKISVVHHGIDPSMSAVASASDLGIRERYSLPERFVLAVGTMQPRKNLGVLAQAMAQVDPAKITDCVVQGSIGNVGGASVVLPFTDQARRYGDDARTDATIRRC